MRIVPAPGRLVRDPETRRLVGDEGLTIDPTNLYWARLLADKDVVEANEKDAAEPVAAAQQPAPEAADAEER